MTSKGKVVLAIGALGLGIGVIYAATKPAKAASVTPPTVKGSVGPGLIYYDGIASSNWEDIVDGRQVPANVPIYLAPQWMNQSAFSIAGHIDLTVDGIPLSTTLLSNQDKQAAPGNGWYVQFGPFTLSTGTHSFTATLSSGGTVLDTKTFTLVAA